MAMEDDRSFQNANLLKPILLTLVLLLGLVAVLLPNAQLPVVSLFISALNLLDFVFHEAGHILFGFMGEFISVLGGTAGQLLVPILLLTAVLYRRQFLSAAYFIFWIGQNFINISPYIGDARQQSLKLLSPGTLFTGEQAIHDWHYLLGHLGLLWVDHFMAAVVYGIGVMVMLLSAAWPILLYYYQYGRNSATPTPRQRM
jgi:hypothetical protein